MNLWEKIGIGIAVLAVLGFVAYNYSTKGIEGSSAFTLGPPLDVPGIIYVSDGLEADDGNDGFERTTPVRTFTRAFEIVNQLDAPQVAVAVLGTSYEVLRNDAGSSNIDVNGPGKTAVLLSGYYNRTQKVSLYGEDDGQYLPVRMHLSSKNGDFGLRGFEIDNIRFVLSATNNTEATVTDVVVGEENEIAVNEAQKGLGLFSVTTSDNSELTIKDSTFFASLNTERYANPISSLVLGPRDQSMIYVQNNDFVFPDHDAVSIYGTEAFNPRSVGIDMPAHGIKVAENHFFTNGYADNTQSLLIQGIRMFPSELYNSQVPAAVAGNDFSDFVGLQIVSQIYRENAPQNVNIYDNYI